MNSLTGKQVPFSWYLGDGSKPAPDAISSSIKILASNSDDAVIHVQDTPLINTTTISRSPKEPSLTHKVPTIHRSHHSSSSASSTSLYVAHKHPHPIDDDSARMVPDELPLKRLKTQSDSPADHFELSINDTFDLGSDFRDINTVEGTDLVDFWFSHQIPSDIIALEEAEREDRIRRRANPIILGKMAAIQKEFMARVFAKPLLSTTIVEKSSDLVDSISNLKSAVISKVHDLYDSTKEVITTNPLKLTLAAIADESKSSSNYVALSSESDRIEFVWPRVSAEVIAAEELARSERTAHRVNPVLLGKWKVINTEFKQKWSTSGLFLAKRIVLDKAETVVNKAEAIVDKAAHVFSDAIHYTTDMLGHLKLGAQDSLHDLEWFKLQEEIERARKINDSADPFFVINKACVERQLIQTIKPIF